MSPVTDISPTCDRQYGFGSEDTRSGIGSPPFARSLTHVLLPAAGGPMTTKRARVPHSPPGSTLNSSRFSARKEVSTVTSSICRTAATGSTHTQRMGDHVKKSLASLAVLGIALTASTVPAEAKTSDGWIRGYDGTVTISTARAGSTSPRSRPPTPPASGRRSFGPRAPSTTATVTVHLRHGRRHLRPENLAGDQGPELADPEGEQQRRRRRHLLLRDSSPDKSGASPVGGYATSGRTSPALSATFQAPTRSAWSMCWHEVHWNLSPSRFCASTCPHLGAGARGAAGVHRDQYASGAFSLLREDAQEHPPTRVKNAAVESGLRGGAVRQERSGLGVGLRLGGANHVRDAQPLVRDLVVVADQAERGFVRAVQALTADLAVQLGNLLHGPAVLGGAALPLATRERLEGTAEPRRGRRRCACRAGGFRRAHPRRW